MMTLFAICFWAGLTLTLLVTFFGGDLSEFHVNSGGGHGHGHGGPTVFNLSSILASLTVFGGVGYMLGTVGMQSSLWILLIAIVSGLLIGWLFFIFYAKVIYKHDYSMRESDFDLNGQLGQLTVPIYGTAMGEMKFVLQGTMRTVSAKSDNGESIPKGAKVVILKMQHGVATVMAMKDALGDLDGE